MTKGHSLVAVLAATGCIGAHGTRARSYAIDAAMGVAGGVILAAALNKHTDFSAGLAFGGLGMTLAFVGTGGTLLTAIGQIGEAQRSDTPGFVAVRPWTKTPDQLPFDPTTAPPALVDETRRAVEAGRIEDCETALEIVDRLYVRDRAVHARLVRDPGIAWCIIPTGEL